MIKDSRISPDSVAIVDSITNEDFGCQTTTYSRFFVLGVDDDKLYYRVKSLLARPPRPH